MWVLCITTKYFDIFFVTVYIKKDGLCFQFDSSAKSLSLTHTRDTLWDKPDPTVTPLWTHLELISFIYLEIE